MKQHFVFLLIHLIQHNNVKLYYYRVFHKKNVMYIYTCTYIFEKKNYIKTQMYIFGTGQDRDDLVPCPVPSRRGILSRPDLSRPETFRDRNFPSQNALGRDGTGGTGRDGKLLNTPTRESQFMFAFVNYHLFSHFRLKVVVIMLR